MTHIITIYGHKFRSIFYKSSPSRHNQSLLSACVAIATTYTYQVSASWQRHQIGVVIVIYAASTTCAQFVNQSVIVVVVFDIFPITVLRIPTQTSVRWVWSLFNSSIYFTRFYFVFAIFVHVYGLIVSIVVVFIVYFYFYIAIIMGLEPVTE